MKIAVYAANMGGFDKVLPPFYPNEPDLDYVYISDHKPTLRKAEKLGWDKVIDASGHKIKDQRRLSRCYHIQSCNVLGIHNYDFAIQHGANIRLTMPPEVLIEKYLGGMEGERTNRCDIALFKHPHRKTVEQEMHICSEMGKDIARNMYPQIQRYRKEGFPIDTFGLSACMLILWRHCETVWEFQRRWWKEVREGSVREQLSFDYVRWKMAPNIQVNYLPGDPFTSPIIRYHQHGAKK